MENSQTILISFKQIVFKKENFESRTDNFYDFLNSTADSCECPVFHLILHILNSISLLISTSLSVKNSPIFGFSRVSLISYIMVFFLAFFVASSAISFRICFE